jgi:hypothetical protein
MPPWHHTHGGKLLTPIQSALAGISIGEATGFRNRRQRSLTFKTEGSYSPGIIAAS